MSGWLAAQNHSPLMTLLVGVVVAIGIGGFGDGALKRVGLRPPAGFTPLVSLTAGTLTLSLAVFVMGVTALATPSALIVSLGVIVSLGWVEGVTRWRRGRPSLPRVPTPALALAGVVLVAALCVAASPPVHPDDAYYHLVAPGRLALDGTLSFFQYPLHAAVISQMGYQLASAPLHAAGMPAAWAVVSVAFWLCLVWLGASLASATSAGSSRSGWVVAGLAAGLYPTAWYATGGAHGMGDATFAGAITLALIPGAMCRRRLTLCALLLVAAGGTKVSLLPMVTLAWCGVLWSGLRGVPSHERALRLGLALAPWVIWQGPALAWAWWSSGSPWGPYMAGLFGESVYDVSALRETIDATIAGNRYAAPQVALFAFVFINPLVWLALVAAIVTPPRDRATVSLLVLLVCQLALMALWLPPDARFLGGLQFVGVLVLAARPRGWLDQRLASRRWQVAGALLTVPWALLGIAEARDSAEVALGLTSPAEYCAEHIPLYPHLSDIDRALPEDAALFTLRHLHGTKLPNAYLPRPVALVPGDVPAARQPYLLWLGPKDREGLAQQVQDRSPWRLGDAVTAPQRVKAPSRRGHSPRRAVWLQVYTLTRGQGDPTDSGSRPQQ